MNPICTEEICYLSFPKVTVMGFLILKDAAVLHLALQVAEGDFPLTGAKGYIVS